MRSRGWRSTTPPQMTLSAASIISIVCEIMWATDYPHQDGFFPGAPQMIRDRIGPLSPAARHQVLAGGAMRFYGMQ